MKLTILLTIGLLISACSEINGPEALPYSISAQSDPLPPPNVCVEWGWQTIQGFPWKVPVCLRWSNDPL